MTTWPHFMWTWGRQCIKHSHIVSAEPLSTLQSVLGWAVPTELPVWKLQVSGPRNVSGFADRAFGEVENVTQGHCGGGGFNPTQLVAFYKEDPTFLLRHEAQCRPGSPDPGIQHGRRRCSPRTVQCMMSQRKVGLILGGGGGMIQELSGSMCNQRWQASKCRKS